MLLGVPACQSQTGLGSLILQVLCQNLACLLIGDLIGTVIVLEKLAIIRVTMIIIGRDIIIVGIMSLEVIFLGLSKSHY